MSTAVPGLTAPDSSAGGGDSTKPRRRRQLPAAGDLAVVLAAGMLGVLIMVWLRRALVEDTYITLGYARQLFENQHWGLLPEQMSNTQTSPLNALLLGGLSYLTGDPLRSLWVLAILNPMLMAWGLVRLARQWQVSAVFAWAALVLLLLNPTLAGTVGMETLLAISCTIWLAERAAAGSAVGYGLLAGLAVLIRLDLVVVVAVIWLLTPAMRASAKEGESKVRGAVKATLVTTVTAAAVCLPWHVFSWRVLGSAIPDTLAIKQNANWGQGQFWFGLWDRFARSYPDGIRPATWLIISGLVVLLLAPLLGQMMNRPWWAPMRLMLAGVAYWVAIGLLGVPPFFWYYGLTIAMLTVGTAWCIALLASRWSAAGLRCGVAGALTATLLLPSGFYWGKATAEQGVPLMRGPVIGNWATSDQYRRIGEYLDKLPKTGSESGIRSGGEFGQMLYFCRCRLIDPFDSRWLIASRLLEQRSSSTLMRLNYRYYDPKDYPRLPFAWRLQFTREKPTGGVFWPVATRQHGAGYWHLSRVQQP